MLHARSRRVHHGSTSAKTRGGTRATDAALNPSFCRDFSTARAHADPPFTRRSTTHNREVPGSNPWRSYSGGKRVRASRRCRRPSVRRPPRVHGRRTRSARDHAEQESAREPSPATTPRECRSRSESPRAVERVGAHRGVRVNSRLASAAATLAGSGRGPPPARISATSAPGSPSRRCVPAAAETRTGHAAQRGVARQHLRSHHVAPSTTRLRAWPPSASPTH